MLIAVAKQDANDLLGELDKRKVRHFEVGYVEEGIGNVEVLKDAKIIEA
jgi:hypothetical protein